jgi:uncharacterized protein (TIGR00730 family)
MSAKPRVAVFGSGTLAPGTPGFDFGVRLGAALARAGATVVTGGYRGAMEAVSRGATEAGGAAIGVTVDLYERRGPANPFLTERVHMRDLHERLRWLITNCDAFVVLPGSIGTLTELFLTWTLVSAGARPPAPIVLLGDGWRDVMARLRQPGWIPEEIARDLAFASDPEQAARLALAHVESELES